VCSLAYVRSFRVPPARPHATVPLSRGSLFFTFVPAVTACLSPIVTPLAGFFPPPSFNPSVLYSAYGPPPHVFSEYFASPSRSPCNARSFRFYPECFFFPFFISFFFFRCMLHTPPFFAVFLTPGYYLASPPCVSFPFLFPPPLLNVAIVP